MHFSLCTSVPYGDLWYPFRTELALHFAFFSCGWMQIPAGESLLFYSLSTTLSLDLGAVVKGFVFISAIEVRTARLVCCFFFFLLIWIQLLQHFMLCLNLVSWVLPLALFLSLCKTFSMQLVDGLSSDGLICLEVESRVQSPAHFVCWSLYCSHLAVRTQSKSLEGW